MSENREREKERKIERESERLSEKKRERERAMTLFSVCVIRKYTPSVCE